MAKKSLKIDNFSTCAAVTNVKVHEVLKSYFPYCLYKSAMKLRSLMDTRLEPLGIIAPQFGALRLLEAAGPMSQIELGREMNIDRATIVKLVDGLEKASFLKRSPSQEDRRVNILTLTSKGEKALKEGTVIRAKVEEEFLSPLTHEERKALKEIIPKLLAPTASK